MIVSLHKSLKLHIKPFVDCYLYFTKKFIYYTKDKWKETSKLIVKYW